MPFEIEIIKAIQTISGPVLDVLVEAFTILGEELFLIPVITIVFWCFNKEAGYWLCYSLISGNLLNNGVKGIFKLPRPIGVEGIRTLRAETATGYSFPSGHTNAISNFMCSAALSLKKRWFWIVAAIVPLLVGFSRLYLGVHWPRDVIGGLVLGFGLPLLLWRLFLKFSFNRPMLFLVTTAVFLPLLFFVDMADFWKTVGLAIGFVAGSFLEEYSIGFETEGSFLRKTLRWILGVVLLCGLYYGMKLLFPPDNLLFAMLRYALVSFFAVAVWPAIFKKLKL